jgi:uncharacterized protein with HEPN domain
MSKRKDADIIKDIKECITRIISYTKGMEYGDFENDFKTQDAVIRNVEIIGEATKLLSNNLKSNYSDIPWADIAGTRDKLIHDYFGANIDIVWSIAKEEIPKLEQQIDEIYK